MGEAKAHAKAKAAAMLQASNKAWSDKLAAARAEAQQLHEQLQGLQQQRDQLVQQVSRIAGAEAALQQCVHVTARESRAGQQQI